MKEEKKISQKKISQSMWRHRQYSEQFTRVFLPILNLTNVFQEDDLWDYFFPLIETTEQEQEELLKEMENSREYT
jgi:hypothetical protein